MSGESDTGDLELATIFFGIFIGLFFFTIVKVVKQTLSIWKRTKDVWNFYVWMIWCETITNFIFALTTYLFIRGIIPPSWAYFLTAMTLWAIQTQLLLQIIANRIGLIMVDRRKAKMLKWGLFIGILLIDISVYCIFTPAHMNVNPTFVRLNKIWERVEKTLFLIIDLGLNVYFLHLVRSRLIANGLTKYNVLFRFNACMVFVSVIMDALLLGMLSLPNQYDYVQFATVAYTVKLNIELLMAELISKVVRSSQRVDNKNSSSHEHHSESHGTNLSQVDKRTSKKPQNPFYDGPNDTFPPINGMKATAHVTASENDKYDGEGIMRTVVTFIDRESEEREDREDLEDCCSKTSIGHASSNAIIT